jgi:hypothetical protein
MGDARDHVVAVSRRITHKTFEVAMRARQCVAVRIEVATKTYGIAMLSERVARSARVSADGAPGVAPDEPR